MPPRPRFCSARATSLLFRSICGRNSAGSRFTAPWSRRISTEAPGSARLRSARACCTRSPKRKAAGPSICRAKRSCPARAQAFCSAAASRWSKPRSARPGNLIRDGAILLLEDRGMKPYQVDRALMHLKQAGKFRGRRRESSSAIFRNAKRRRATKPCGTSRRRILGRWTFPSCGARRSATRRAPMLTLPLGVRAELSSAGARACCAFSNRRACHELENSARRT